MKKYLLFLLLSFSGYLNAQVNRIDHFFVSSPKAEKLFTLFKDDLGLPVAWDYKNWGSFASGAVTLGNVAFEFVLFDSLTTTKFDAIALEPRQSVEELLPILDSNRIAHDSVEYNTYTKKDGSIAGWSTLNLRNLMPEEAGLFICDYKDRQGLASAKRRDSVELSNRKGGPLGIILLKEIVVASPDINNYKTKLVTLPGISSTKANIFNFSSGTSIRLSNSKILGIEKIVIRVNSLAIAIRHLKSNKMLGKVSENSIFIDPQALEGLLIELTEK